MGPTTLGPRKKNCRVGRSGPARARPPPAHELRAPSRRLHRLPAHTGAELAPLDEERWGYIAATNFLLVAWVWWGRSGRRIGVNLSPPQWVVLIVVLLIFSRTQFNYFDHHDPRIIGWHGFRQFVHSFEDGSMFRITSM
jgi:hypothetical protein